MKRNNQILEEIDKIETMAANIKYFAEKGGNEKLIDHYLQQIGEVVTKLRNDSRE